MYFKNFIYILILLITSANGQSIPIQINGYDFVFVEELLDGSEGGENKIVTLYRGNKKLLNHTLLKEEADCSSISLQLGNYSVVDNKIIFYSYWAVSDRMPSSLLPYGFLKQIYNVDGQGLITLEDANIYIEDYVENDNKDFFESSSGWKHKGLKYLAKKDKNNIESKLVDDYIQKIEKKYKAKFVLSTEREQLEKEVRLNLNQMIQEYTRDWVEGEAYGKIKK